VLGDTSDEVSTGHLVVVVYVIICVNVTGETIVDELLVNVEYEIGQVYVVIVNTLVV